MSLGGLILIILGIVLFVYGNYNMIKSWKYEVSHVVNIIGFFIGIIDFFVVVILIFKLFGWLFTIKLW